MKYYKIVFGFKPDEYLSITSNELHKALTLAKEGGKAIFENGFLSNRGNDIMRIVPDWHTLMGWHKGHEMNSDDYFEISKYEDDYQKTLNNARLLTDFIKENNRHELLGKPASEAFKEIKSLLKNPDDEQISNKVKMLSDNFKK